MAGAAAIVATVIYVRDVLGRGELAFAVAMAALRIGSSVAAVLVTRRAERAERVDAPGRFSSRDLAVHLRHHRWASWTRIARGLLLSASLLPGLLRPPYLVLLALWTLNGAGQAMIAVASVGILARHTAPDERGGAYAAHFALTHIFWLGSYPAVGFLGRAVGVPVTFTLAGVVTLLGTIAALFVRHSHRKHAVHDGGGSGTWRVTGCRYELPAATGRAIGPTVPSARHREGRSGVRLAALPCAGTVFLLVSPAPFSPRGTILETPRLK